MEKFLNRLMAMTFVAVFIALYMGPVPATYVVVSVMVVGSALLLTYMVGMVCMWVCAYMARNLHSYTDEQWRTYGNDDRPTPTYTKED